MKDQETEIYLVAVFVEQKAKIVVTEIKMSIST